MLIFYYLVMSLVRVGSGGRKAVFDKIRFRCVLYN